MAKNPYPTVLLEKYRKEYGDVFTFYLGNLLIFIIFQMFYQKEKIYRNVNFNTFSLNPHFNSLIFRSFDSYYSRIKIVTKTIEFNRSGTGGCSQ